VFCEEDGFRKFCTDCTYIHPLTTRILFEIPIVSTVCIIAIFLVSLSLVSCVVETVLWFGLGGNRLAKILLQTKATYIFHVSLTGVLK